MQVSKDIIDGASGLVMPVCSCRGFYLQGKIPPRGLKKKFLIELIGFLLFGSGFCFDFIGLPDRWRKGARVDY